MSDKKIIGIVGHCSIGKTTLLNKIMKSHLCSDVIIPETNIKQCPNCGGDAVKEGHNNHCPHCDFWW